MNKEDIKNICSNKLNEIYREICKEDGLRLNVSEGYIPVNMAIKMDSLLEYMTDHVDEILLINKQRQRPAPLKEEELEESMFTEDNKKKEKIARQLVMIEAAGLNIGKNKDDDDDGGVGAGVVGVPEREFTWAESHANDYEMDI